MGTRCRACPASDAPGLGRIGRSNVAAWRVNPGCQEVPSARFVGGPLCDRWHTTSLHARFFKYTDVLKRHVARWLGFSSLRRRGEPISLSWIKPIPFSQKNFPAYLKLNNNKYNRTYRSWSTGNHDLKIKDLYILLIKLFGSHWILICKKKGPSNWHPTQPWQVPWRKPLRAGARAKPACSASGCSRKIWQDAGLLYGYHGSMAWMDRSFSEHFKAFLLDLWICPISFWGWKLLAT